MAIRYCLDSQGGFICGDTETQITCYAYPTSTSATAAKKHPAEVAAEMIKRETENGAWMREKFQTARDYDARNWAKLYLHGQSYLN